MIVIVGLSSSNSNNSGNSNKSKRKQRSVSGFVVRNLVLEELYLVADY